jgi:O-antigen/teichoic acid export membrane protein
MRRDVMAAYFAAGSRIGAWALVSAIVYRLASPAQFAMLALIRGTIGILNYAAIGLAPALIRHFAAASQSHSPLQSDDPKQPGEITGPGAALSNANERAIFSTGIVIAAASTVVGLIITLFYARFFDRIHVVPPGLGRAAPWAVILIGLGTLLRLFSDAPGALLKTKGRIAKDNYILASGDIFWALATAAAFHWAGLLTASITYAAAGLVVAAARTLAVQQLKSRFWPLELRLIQWRIGNALLSFGSLLLLAQIAEYFYAPTDYILINHFFGPGEVAAYAPGTQIDMALLMLVTGLAAVLLPKSALAHTRGDPKLLRQYYSRGTFASIAVLIAASAGIWFLYPVIFHLWFGAHPPNTHAILDLVLIGTIVGGSSAVGRSVLIGMGRIKAVTAAAIIAGVVNVLASYCFVKFAHAGLRGILYGTLIAVVGRCGVWMPAYVLLVLRRENALAK